MNMCECIKGWEEKLTKHLTESGIDLAEPVGIECMHGLNAQTHQLRRVYGQYIHYTERKVSKNGNERKIKKKQFIEHRFCPFCGTETKAA